MDQEIMNDAAETPLVPEPETGEVSEADELSVLREALAEKERALAEKEQALADVTAQQDKYAAEFAEFRKEFPEVPLGKVTEEVWNEVKKGVPLAAAYALSEHRAMKQAKVSAREAGAWHSLSGGTDEGLFTPSEVRAMTQYEVRRNYDRILESMKRW